MIYNVFSAMANKYSALFLGGFSDAELEAAKDGKERMEICRKRITESWFLYSLLEMKQRYLLKG